MMIQMIEEEYELFVERQPPTHIYIDSLKKKLDGPLKGADHSLPPQRL